jgi:hypothetical protein
VRNVQKQATQQVAEWVPYQEEVNVTTYQVNNVQKQATRTVVETVPYQEEITVNVARWRNVEREATRLVCEVVPQQQEVTYQLVSYRQVAKQGTRKRQVAEWVPETVTVAETYYENVPYQYTVNVPVSSGSSCGWGYAGGHSYGGYGGWHHRHGCW